MDAETQIETFRNQMHAAIVNGDDRIAGMRAGHIVSWHNASERVRTGQSPDLASDPLYGRYFNVTEYFNNPRAATANDVVVNYG